MDLVPKIIDFISNFGNNNYLKKLTNSEANVRKWLLLFHEEAQCKLSKFSNFMGLLYVKIK